MTTDDKRPHVVIIGGGFGGLECARSLPPSDFRVTLIDSRNFHLFQPLLYQVATGGLSPANIAAPLRGVLARRKNVSVRMGEVVDILPDEQRVCLNDGHVDYDELVVATGVRHNYFGHNTWEQFAPGLKTVEDAVGIRHRVLEAFERAERATDPGELHRLLTFVVIGGGPTGVEMAGAIAELARGTLRGNFRRINPAHSRVLLIEAGPRVLAAYTDASSNRAMRSLERLGVTVWLNTRVVDISASMVSVIRNGVRHNLPTRAAIWAAGVQASHLGATLRDRAGATLDQVGRVIVEKDLSIAGQPHIFVIGDLANYPHQTGEPLPGIAPVAMQQGRFVADRLGLRYVDADFIPFHYHHRGSMATIGRAAAVAEIGRWRFSGYPAWLAWLFIHVLFLIEFESRVLVMIQWAWNYFTRNRSARLITGDVDAALSDRDAKPAPHPKSNPGNAAAKAPSKPAKPKPRRSAKATQ
ncbi:MAG: NAD(P)/FAD-dependent oxidoreductase [Phycisphaerales bacterium]|nr:NAD(P)/FAD-dependent oxidoreductase [Phycisphaerales bacterium]